MIKKYNTIEEFKITDTGSMFNGWNSITLVVLIDKYKVLEKVAMGTGIQASSNKIKNS